MLFALTYMTAIIAGPKSGVHFIGTASEDQQQQIKYSIKPKAPSLNGATFFCMEQLTVSSMRWKIKNRDGAAQDLCPFLSLSFSPPLSPSLSASNAKRVRIYTV
jgi:hypothetical protein